MTTGTTPTFSTHAFSAQSFSAQSFSDHPDGPAIGSESWWQQIAALGTPLQEPQDDGQVRLDFLHRGSAETARVLIDVNGVTDHHSAHPAELEHLEGTDVWWWSAAVRPDYRGAYCFIPLMDPAQGDPPPRDDADRTTQRRWWVSMLKQSVADEFNAYRPLRGSWDTPASVIHLADAPPQPAWSSVDRLSPAALIVEPLGATESRTWTSATLGNTRRVWTHQVGKADDDQPLVVLLDGQHWVERLSLPRALDAAHALGLPSCFVIMIDSLDSDTRGRELPCHDPFWRAVVDELLPSVAEDVRFTESPARTIVAGQSYGGLAALYAGLTRPDRFGVVLSQSGSYWWPNFSRAGADGPPDPSQGRLTLQVRAGLGGDNPLRIHQEVGRLEGDMNLFNEEMRAALEDEGHDVTYTVFEGGHEWLCWRGGLIDGLTALLGQL